MSVYTTVTQEELVAWLARYSVGAVEAFEPIESGIENTNYFVTAARGRYVLTLYERLPAEELPFYLNLMAHLARAGIRCPDPEPDRTGALFSVLNGKPAALLSRLDGAPRLAPTPEHCAAVGATLARMHLAGASYRTRHANRRGPTWWRQAARAVRPFLDAGQNALIAEELRFQASLAKRKLPHGAIHADLFRDNVLWADDGQPGVIDFGFAATDVLAYDLAITVNDWCIFVGGPRHGELQEAHVRAMTAAYEAVRPLTFEEKTGWSGLLRAAALRFWLSRLYDLHLPRPGELVHAHDPAEFEHILRDRVSSEPVFPEP
jgi:homoserine kinase type II